MKLLVISVWCDTHSHCVKVGNALATHVILAAGAAEEAGVHLHTVDAPAAAIAGSRTVGGLVRVAVLDSQLVAIGAFHAVVAEIEVAGLCARGIAAVRSDVKVVVAVSHSMIGSPKVATVRNLEA